MARFAQIDSQIRADRLMLANRFRVPEQLNPLFQESRFGGLKLVNRRFEAIRRIIRANRSHVMKIGVSLGSGQEVCFGPSSPDPGRDLDGSQTL